jgi:hypothetical protein
LKIFINFMSFDGLKGENLDLGPSKDMRFLGPSNCGKKLAKFGWIHQKT